MLTFLAIASKQQLTVESYRDQAVGVLAKNSAGNMAVTKVTLRPEIRFSGEKQPTNEELRQLHDKAHHACFIANSVKTDVTIEPA
jgi:organic hydroperoxide reductase OsmC/OhrA